MMVVLRPITIPSLSCGGVRFLTLADSSQKIADFWESSRSTSRHHVVLALLLFHSVTMRYCKATVLYCVALRVRTSYAMASTLASSTKTKVYRTYSCGKIESVTRR